MANPYFDFRLSAAAEQQRFDLPEGATEIVIGRSSDCGWVISSTAVSRHHARLLHQGDKFVIEDLRSSNGTFVNGERLTGPRALRDQDRVQVGAVEATFVVPPRQADSDATIAFVAKPGAARTPTQPEVPEPPPVQQGGTGTHTVPSPPPPAPPAPGVPAAAESTAAAPPVPPAAPPVPAAATPPAPAAPSAASVAAATAEAAVKPPTTREGGPSVVELALIALGSFLVVFVIGALLIRLVL